MEVQGKLLQLGWILPGHSERWLGDLLRTAIQIHYVGLSWFICNGVLPLAENHWWISSSPPFFPWNGNSMGIPSPWGEKDATWQKPKATTFWSASGCVGTWKASRSRWKSRWGFHSRSFSLNVLTMPMLYIYIYLIILFYECFWMWMTWMTSSFCRASLPQGF